MIGIMDFNPDQNPDKRQYIKRISSLIPADIDAKGIFFRDGNIDYSEFDALILSGSKLSATDYQRMLERGELVGDDYFDVNNAVQKLSCYQGPMFGICFGAQILAHVMGGKLGKLDKTEAGYLEHQLTEAGKQSLVFGHLPDKFLGAHLHTDYVASLPEQEGLESKVIATRNGVIHAYSICKNGVMRYGVQPHPEMSNPENATFLVKVNEGWLRDAIGEEEYEKALRMLDNAEFGLAQTITKFVESIR